MAYSTIKHMMKKYDRMSPIERGIRDTLELGLLVGVELPLALLARLRHKDVPERCSTNDDRYFTKVFPLDVPQIIPMPSLDRALEDVGRSIDSEKKVSVEYSGLLYHLYLRTQALEGHLRGNLCSVSLPKDLSYFEHNHVQDFWIEPDGSLYVAINVYHFPTLEETELPVPVKSFPLQNGKSYMGGLVDLLFFDPIIGEHIQVYLQPANTTINRNLFWRYSELEETEDITVGSDVPYYAVVVLRDKHKQIVNLVLDKLQSELRKVSE